MKVRQIMTTNVECIAPDAGVANDRLAGTVTDRDIVIRGIAGGRDLNTCKARDIMTSEVHWCFEDQDVKDVAKKMREKDVRRMLILSQDKRLVGVVSIGDLAKVEERESGKTLKDITEAA